MSSIPCPTDPYCHQCCQLKPNFVGQYPLALRQNPLPYPDNILEQRCTGCSQVRPYEQILKQNQSSIQIANHDTNHIMITSSAELVSIASRKENGNPDQYTSHPELSTTQSSIPRFATYSLFENAVNSAKSGNRNILPTSRISSLRRRGSTRVPTFPANQHSTNISTENKSPPRAFERRLRLLFRSSTINKIEEIPGSEIWRPDSNILDTVIQKGSLYWTVFLEYQILRKTALWQEFVKQFWNMDPPVCKYNPIETDTGQKKYLLI